MLHGKKIIAVIPARGGSKGIPEKNIYPLCGKPLIAYTIESALACKNILDEIHVSTDSPKIAEIAEKYGIKVPLLRPAELAGDKVKTIEVAKYILSLYPQNAFDIFLLLQPTAPLRSPEDIVNCLEIVCSNENCTSVVSVCKLEEPHPFKLKKILDGYLVPFIDGTSSEIPRQELPPAYRLNGAIYAAKIPVINQENNFFGNCSIPYLMPEKRSISIDCFSDLALAEFFIKNKLTI